MDIDRGAEPFVKLGYDYDETLQYDDWYAKVFRKVGYPALFVDQAYPDERGHTSIIPGWVKKFGDKVFHHVAVRVEDIELAVARLQEQGVVLPETSLENVAGHSGRFFCTGDDRWTTASPFWSWRSDTEGTWAFSHLRLTAS
ncbi:MAG: hypothetical protein MRJ68_12240 [Nitrospira sp.]|nr:hypothetical protein [Nitrospira sp.]